jgi:hypothetical protein
MSVLIILITIVTLTVAGNLGVNCVFITTLLKQWLWGGIYVLLLASHPLFLCHLVTSVPGFCGGGMMQANEEPLRVA